MAMTTIKLVEKQKFGLGDLRHFRGSEETDFLTSLAVRREEENGWLYMWDRRRFRMGEKPSSLGNEKIPGRVKREERRTEDGEMDIQR